MHYLDDLGCETEEQEYKVFTFNPYCMGKNDGFKVLKSGKWNFDDLTKSTLKGYIQNYFPKYFCAFSHPRTTVKLGKFYIGIDDDGIVHGIPYSGELTEEFIRKQILKTIPKIRGINDYDCVDKYLDHLKIEVVKLDKTKNSHKVSDYGLDSEFNIKTFTTLKKKEQVEDLKYKDYVLKKRRWELFYNSFPQKINDIVNDKKIRSQLIDLIKAKSTSTTKLNPKYKNIYGWCEIKNDYWNMITELKSDKLYEQVTFDSAEKIRNEPLSPIYWGLVWRDLKTSPCKILKPQIYRPKYNYKQYAILMASQVPKMIPSWIKNNPDLNLYVIKIIFPGNISSELFLEYQDDTRQWIQSYRTTVDGEPRCQPIY
jgi:hypothetical protein